MPTITLKDSGDNDVVFHRIGYDQDSLRFTTRGASLVGNAQLDLRLIRKANVNRVTAKLSVPSLCAPTDPCSPVKVAYTEVGSLDLSSVLIASEADRDNFVAMFASLAALPAVSDMFTDGILPSA